MSPQAAYRPDMGQRSGFVPSSLRITASKDELVTALGVVSRAVSTRTSVQILSGILLEALNESTGGSELRLAATDMELSLRATVAAQIEGDGAIVLPGKTLVDIARLLPADEVVSALAGTPTRSGFHRDRQPTLMIGQFRTTWPSRSVNVPFFSTALIWVSLLSTTGFAPAFQVRIVSAQSGE